LRLNKRRGEKFLTTKWRTTAGDTAIYLIDDNKVKKKGAPFYGDRTGLDGAEGDIFSPGERDG